MTDAASPRTASASLEGAVAEFAASQRGPGLDAVALQVVEREGAPAITGRVLTSRQAKELNTLAQAHGAGVDVRVAADPDSGLEEGWSEIAVSLLNLWRTPERAGQEMGRQTQYLASDGPLRRLGTVGDWALVQGPDLAMGWAAAGEIRDVSAPAASAWHSLPRAAAGATRPPFRVEGSAEDLLERARAELGVPYVWGGTTHAGFDCSGLVQRLILLSTGVLMPRHTGDQRRVGERVVEAEVTAGDLLFATPRGQKVGHVLLMTAPATVLHACRTEHRVIEESLGDNAARYQHQGWRRPVDLRA